MHAWLLAAILIRALGMPHGATIDPFGNRALMAVARDGTVGATVTVAGYLKRTVLWNRDGWRRAAVPGTLAAFDESGAALIDAQRPQRVVGSSAIALDLSTCENFPQSSTGPVLAGTLANGSLIAWMRSPAIVDLDDTSGQNAPVVLHLRSGQCLNMGNGIALSTAGLFTGGYMVVLDGVPAPSNVVSSKERFVALRWHERTREPLGDGVVLAIAADGTAAGSDVPPGNGAAFGALPQALLWHAGERTAIRLAPGAALSVAYAVDARGRVAGMLEDEGHRHYAFLWRDGALRRLDDLVRQPGWRFECAYAFTPYGGLVGIGTYRGTPAAFEIEGL